VHFHIVPRWNGDTNFMPVLNEVKLISEFMDETYEKLKKSLNELVK
jgi:ATP adenylyltransferase